MVNPLSLLSGFAEGLRFVLSGDRTYGRIWVRKTLRCSAALSFGLLATIAQAHPEGTVDCRAEIHLEGGRLQSMRAELWLDRTHTLQALGQVRAKDSKKIDPKRMELLTDSVRIQFARFQWLFDLKADGQSQKMEPKSPPSLDFVDGSLRLLIDQVASGSSTTSDGAVPKLWTLTCFDPSYYWAPAFRKLVHTSSKSSSKSHEAHPEDDKDPPPLPASGHRSIKVDKSPQDPEAVKVSGCSGRRAARPEDGVQVPRAGVAQLDWVCQP
jgi:ABC-type uncharacterized transport system substrate-binding protein